MRKKLKVLFAVLIINLFIMRPISSYADGHDHDGNQHGHDSGHSHDGGHDHGHHDHSYVGINFSVWPDNYYYSSPYYPPADEVFVSPPVYQPVAINGTTYYLNDGNYYAYNGYGYQAVAPPVQVIQPPIVADQDQGAPDSFTINIPNDKGGYTSVTLRKSGDGYVGPQGEYYPKFPAVSQLEVIYGK